MLLSLEKLPHLMFILKIILIGIVSFHQNIEEKNIWNIREMLFKNNKLS